MPTGDSNGSRGRNVLGDLTNRPLKRGLSFVLDDALSNSRDPKGKSKVLRTGDSMECEKLISEDKVVGVGKLSSFLKERGDLNDQISSSSVPPSLSGDIYSVGGLGTGFPDEGRQSSDKDESATPMVIEDLVLGGDISHADKNFGVGKLASNKSGSIEWSRLPLNSQVGTFELEKCKFLKGSEARTCQGKDLIGDCSCSFCLKAAYIWSDLHYQDIKGRVNALRKSQKEASILLHEISKGKDIGANIFSNTSKPSELDLESSLVNQWRSLFLHMENVLAQENNQLQANYTALSDLRENCKMDLEVINRMPLKKDKQP
ncbi:hypothetical protein SAY86_001786 [Trapa natans]|uniref:Uncharacterized protein n=1 Tax=Trapa natans TaxID=22666 RepID=A0AAN7LEH3_TRANT|nr:hypothetical protein SAY86_001786 [Trapa natans]